MSKLAFCKTAKMCCLLFLPFLERKGSEKNFSEKPLRGFSYRRMMRSVQKHNVCAKSGCLFQKVGIAPALIDISEHQTG